MNINGCSHISSSVVVHVYDIFKFNNYIDRLGFGVYHTGVEVYGTEYCYGGHPNDMTGIFPMEPKDIEALGDEYTFKTSINVGSTDFTENDVRQIIDNLGVDFCGIEYNLLKKNCNHFSSAFIQYLCGQTLPKWINRLAETSSSIPFVDKIIPKEWLRPQDYMEEETAEDFYPSNSQTQIYTKSFSAQSNTIAPSTTPTSSNSVNNHQTRHQPPPRPLTLPNQHPHASSSKLADTNETRQQPPARPIALLNQHPHTTGNDWIVIGEGQNNIFNSNIGTTSDHTNSTPSFSQLHQQKQQQQKQNRRKSSTQSATSNTNPTDSIIFK